jgi:competence protein ComEC
MDWWLFTFWLGAILSLFVPTVPEFSFLIACLAMSSLLIASKYLRFLGIIIMAGGWLIYHAISYQTIWTDNGIAQLKLHKKALLITGVVKNIAVTSRGSTRFNINVSHINQQPLTRPLIARIRWDKPEYDVFQGQTWQLTVKLKPAHGLANVGSFRYQSWLRQKNIVATGYVKKSVNNMLLENDISWRHGLYHRFRQLLPQHELSGVLLALGFGERGELTAEHWRILQATATQHLIAISGLHLGLIASASFIFTLLVIRIFPINHIISNKAKQFLMLGTAQSCAIVISCLLALYYSYLSGFSIPTVRALIMLYLFWLLRLLAVSIGPLRGLLLTVVIICLLMPMSLLSVSFWLSITALTVIFATLWRFPFIKPRFTPDSGQLQLGIHRCYIWFIALFKMQLALTLVMMPVAALLNHQLPLLAILGNLVAVPLMSISAIPLTLLAVISLPLSEWLSSLFVNLALYCLEFIWCWLTWLSSFDWALLVISHTQLMILFFCLLIVGGYLFVRPSFLSQLTIVALFVGYQLKANYFDNREGNWSLTVLDVGHGLSVIIEKQHRAIVYDTGVKYPNGFSIAEAVIAPYLNYQGITKLDAIIISHSDNDHAGGLKQLVAQYPTSTVIADDQSLLPTSRCTPGILFDWQGLHFEVLSPSNGHGETNDESCVIRISDEYHSVLLTGDISKKVEKRLLRDVTKRPKLASDVLIAPHHGSKSSSSAKFLRAVSPQYAVFSVGYLNRWQMPSTLIQQRYRHANIDIFSTAESGMVGFEFADQGISTITYRDDIKPYWFEN